MFVNVHAKKSKHHHQSKKKTALQHQRHNTKPSPTLSIGDWIQSVGSSKGIFHFFYKILFFIDFGYWFFCVWNWFCNWFCNWFFGIDFLGFFGGSLWVRFCSHLASQTAKTNAYHPQSHALSIYTLQWTKNKQFAHNRSSHLCSFSPSLCKKAP